MSEHPTWQPTPAPLPVHDKPAPLDPTPATWQEQDNDPLAQLLTEQNMTLDGLRQFLDAAWAVVVAWDHEPETWKVIRAAGKLSGVAEAVTNELKGWTFTGGKAQDGT